MEGVKNILEVAGYFTGLFTLIFFAYQYKKSNLLQEYNLLQSLESKYTLLISKNENKETLNEIWNEIPKKRKSEIEDFVKANNNNSKYPYWDVMNNEERDCYRLARSVLETLEQCHLAESKGFINDVEIVKKWDGWVKEWKNNVYAKYVLSEMP